MLPEQRLPRETLGGVAADVRFSFRSICRAPGFALTAMLLLAIGFGVNTGMFALTRGVLWRPLPYPAADRLAIVTTSDFQGGDYGVRRHELDAWLGGFRSASAATAYRTQDAAISDGAQVLIDRVAYVTPSFFEALGVTPSVGELDRRTLASGGVVISPSLAMRFRADQGEVRGRLLTVGDRTHPVAAIAPSGVEFPAPGVAAWAPIAAAAPPSRCEPQDHECLSVATDDYRLLVRLRAGASLAALRDDAARLQTEIRGEAWETPPTVTLLGDAVTGRVRLVLQAMLVGSLLVLAVACANVTALFVNRGITRRREFGVRRALGSGTGRIVRAAVVESLLVTGAGLAIGFVIAMMGLRLVQAVATGFVPRLDEVVVDGPAAATSAALALMVAVLCGTASAWRACRQPPAESLHGARATSPRLGGARAVLAIVQIALAVVLLTSGGLLMRTVVEILGEDTGVETAGALSARLLLRDTLLFDSTERAAYVTELLDRVRALPGVSAAGIGSNLPPAAAPMSIGIGISTPDGMRSQLLKLGSASPGYFEALGARLLAGRGIEDRDAAEDAPSIVLSESAASFLFPDGGAVGRELSFRLPPLVGLKSNPRVVGVVSDIRYDGLEAPPPAALYVPWSTRATGVTFLVIRVTSGSGSALGAAVRAISQAVGPGIPTPDLRPLDQAIVGSIPERWFRLALVAAFGVLSLSVALVGLVGLLVRLVAERRHELAIRAALGASPRRLMAFVMTRGGYVTSVGLFLGVGGASVAGRGIASLLYGVVPDDPGTLFGVVGVVALVSAAACAGPARRAGRIDPVTALRSE